MIYSIIIKPKEDFKFENSGHYLHSLFSKVFNPVNMRTGKKNKRYSFQIDKRRIYLKNKKYRVRLHTSHPEIDSLIQSDLRKDAQICSVKEDELDLSNLIKVEYLRYPINKRIKANWGIDDDSEFYRTSHGKELLKELIQVQVSDNLQLTETSKARNGKPMNDFIDTLIVRQGHNEFTNRLNVLIEVKNDIESKKAGRFIVLNGIGTKNSYGDGFAEYVGEL